jgi:hypothetical protein
MTPKEILDSTTPEVRKIIDQILKVEKAQKHIQNLSSIKSVEAKIADDILKIIYQEIK